MNKKVAKNYIYHMLYQILVLVAPLVTTPYVSRVLGATNIGIYGYAQSIASYFVLIGVVGTSLYGQREIAYLQDNPIERSKTFWEIEIFRLTAVILCTIVYYLAFCLRGEYAPIYKILTFEVLAAGFDISWLFAGMEDFRVTVIRNTIIKVTGIVLVFLLVKTSDDLPLYTICVTLPLFIANISLWFATKKYIVQVRSNLKELWQGIKRRIRPILVLFLPQVARDVYLVLDKTMIGLLSSHISQVGYYTQAQKIVKLTMSLATSLGTVMMPAMAAYFSKGDHDGIVNSIRKAFHFIYMLSFALMFGICAVSTHFAPVFFGKDYDPVAILMVVISPIIVIIATSNVIGTQYLLPTKQQNAFTASIITGATVNFTLNCLLIPQFDAIGASIGTVIAELAVTTVQCIYVRKQLPLKEFFRSGIKYAICGAIMMISVRLIGTVLPKRMWAVVVMVVVGVIVYVGELLIIKEPMIKMGIRLFRQKTDKPTNKK